MEIKLEKIEVSLLLSGLKRVLSKYKREDKRFVEAIEKKSYERFSDGKKKKILRNKRYKQEKVKNLIETLEKSLNADEVSVLVDDSLIDFSKMENQ